MKIAVARHAIGAPGSFDEFARRQRRLLGDVAAQGAEIAVLPEYLSLELGASFEPAVAGDLAASLAAIQRYRDDWLALFSGIARDTGMLVAAGTFLLDVGGGRYRNRCDLFAPDGGHGWQDKLQLTGFEKRAGMIDGGDALKVFEHRGLRRWRSATTASSLPVRAQYGRARLLVPCDAAGATRVRVGCGTGRRTLLRRPVGDRRRGAVEPRARRNTGEAAVFAHGRRLPGRWGSRPRARGGRLPTSTAPRRPRADA